ncbi:MAG: TlpA disulfide reductase family protein [Acidobacteriia bacterium]|nr:TlpA disulfide reductase family protein [Terriglobia bacterium]
MRLLKKAQLWKLLLFLVSIGAGLMTIKGARSSHDMVLHRGQALPAFRVETQEGERISRESLIGWRVLIAFFNVECEHCTREIPMWDHLLSGYPKDSLTAIAVSESESFKTRAFARQRSSRIRYITDNNHILKKLFKVKALPTVFLVDREGHIQNTLIGEHGADVSRRILQDFLRRSEVGSITRQTQRNESANPIWYDPPPPCDKCKAP